MTVESIVDMIVKVGVEPAIIAALLYLVYKLITDVQKTTNELCGSVSDLATSVDRLAEYVRGRNNA